MADYSAQRARRLHPSARARVDKDAALHRDIADGSLRTVPRRLVCRFDDHAVFAYARGHDLVRRSDDAVWAHLSGDVVLSARSGEPLAYRTGSVLYDAVTRLPAYYFIDT